MDMDMSPEVTLQDNFICQRWAIEVERVTGTGGRGHVLVMVSHDRMLAKPTVVALRVQHRLFLTLPHQINEMDVC